MSFFIVFTHSNHGSVELFIHLFIFFTFFCSVLKLILSTMLVLFYLSMKKADEDYTSCLPAHVTFYLQSTSAVLHRALNIHPFRSILIIKMITVMKDHTLLAVLWGDYIVNDSNTDGHKLLITSEMSLQSAGKDGVCMCWCGCGTTKPASWPCEHHERLHGLKGLTERT